MQARLQAIVLSICGLTLYTSHAQDAAVNSAARTLPTYAGVHTEIGGIFVTPVANAPFSATVDIVSHQQMPDGSEHVVTTTNHIARSSSGRIYNERRVLVPVGFKGEPRLISAHIYDPSSRQSTYLDPQRRLARQMTLREPARTSATLLPPSQRNVRPGITETDLGIQNLDGVELSGRRDTRTIPAEASGTGKPVVITDDYWFSEALSVYMIVRHNDVRTGEQLIAVTKVQRTEPDAQRFVIPPDYKVVDETTPEAPRAAR